MDYNEEPEAFCRQCDLLLEQRRKTAQEIERLRAELADMERKNEQFAHMVVELKAQLAAKDAEIARLNACRVKIDENHSAGQWSEVDCPCCGDVAAEGYWFLDGTALMCGCNGKISCCSETEAHAVVFDCDCEERKEGEASRALAKLAAKDAEIARLKHVADDATEFYELTEAHWKESNAETIRQVGCLRADRDALKAALERIDDYCEGAPDLHKGKPIHQIVREALAKLAAKGG